MTTSPTQPHLAPADADLSCMDLPDVVVIRQNITLKRVTEQWPRMGVKQFPTQRPAPVPGKGYLRAVCGFFMADDEIKREAGLPVGAQYVEIQVIDVGFWDFREARHYRGFQCCATHDESLGAELAAAALFN